MATARDYLVFRSEAHGAKASVAPLHRSDSYRFSRVLLAIMLVVTVDVTNYLDRGSKARYLLVIVPLVAVVLIKTSMRSTHIRRSSVPDRILLPLFLFALVGSVYGKVFDHTMASALALSLPMVTAFAYLGTMEAMTEEEAWRVLRYLVMIGTLYIFINAIANSGHGPHIFQQSSGKSAYRNSQILFVALGFGAAISAKRWWRVGLLTLLFAIIFKGYPSATTVAVMGTAMATVWMTRPNASRKRPLLVALGLSCLILVAVLSFSFLINLSASYFSAVGKQNDNGGRIAEWQAGIQDWLASPIYGSAFTGETVIFSVREAGLGAPIQGTPNSDYIEVLVLGGAIGIVLLLAWYGATEVTVLHRYWAFLDTGQPNHASLLRALLVGFNAYACAALFNPLFAGASRTATLFAIYGLMMVMGDPRKMSQRGTGDLPRPASGLERSVGNDPRLRVPVHW